MAESETDAGGRPRVWLVDLDRSAAVLEAYAAATGCLSADDRERASEVGDARLARERLATTAALRWALEGLLGTTVRGLAFERHPEGKPYLPERATAFNISHSGGFALIVVAERGAVGIDLETLRPIQMGSPHRERIVAAGEGLVGHHPRVSATAAAADQDTLQGWARLEAYGKARGVGVARVMGELGLRGAASPAWHATGEIASAASAAAARHGLAVIDLVLPAGLLGAFAGTELPLSNRPEPFPTDWPSLMAPLASASRRT
jgi:4'-phosphopantetheinyl transferase